MTVLSLLLISAGMWTLGIGIGLEEPWLWGSGAVAICAGCGLLWLVDRLRRPARLEERDWEFHIDGQLDRSGGSIRKADAYRRHDFGDRDKRKKAA